MGILTSTSKKALSFLLLLMSSKNWRRGQSRFFLEARGLLGVGVGRGGGRNGPNNVCTYE
jgi:hypothetical protein